MFPAFTGSIQEQTGKSGDAYPPYSLLITHLPLYTVVCAHIHFPATLLPCPALTEYLFVTGRQIGVPDRDCLLYR